MKTVAPIPVTNTISGRGKDEDYDFFSNTRFLEVEEVKKVFQEAQEAPNGVEKIQKKSEQAATAPLPPPGGISDPTKARSAPKKIPEQPNHPPDTSMRQEEEDKAEEAKTKEVPEPTNIPPELRANAPPVPSSR